MNYELFFFETNAENYPPQNKTLASICPVYAERYRSSNNEQKKKNAIASGILLRDYMGITHESQLSFNDCGKPKVQDCFFSLSHSNDCSVLAVSHSTVGVDIEQISTPCTAIIEQIFPIEFKQEYSLAADDEKAVVFYRLWTKMEAHLKAEGFGFTKDPRLEKLKWDKYTYETQMYKDYCVTVALAR
jgi:4'-phosphopantetheinyl transferase